MKWMMKKPVGWMLLALLLALSAPVFAQDVTTAQVIDSLNVRSGPSTDHATIATLPRLADVLIEGRNPVGNWALVHTPDSAIRGWVATRYLITPDDFFLGGLPITEEVLPDPVSQSAQPAAAASPAPVENPQPASGTLTLTVIASSLNVRTGPGSGYTSIGALTWHTAVTIEGRNAVGDWALVQQPGGLRGWVAARYLAFPDGVSIASVPVTGEAITVPDTPAPSGVSPEVAAMEAQLAAVPIVPQVTARARAIYEQGRRAGRNPRMFTKVGDCNSESLAFMYAFDWGSYNLGEYADLQPTVDYFSGAFAHSSVAGRVGFSAVSVIDSTWADPSVCRPGEASVYCEYRISNASFAIIMFGANDLSVLTPERYESALRHILDLSIEAGVVPVLSTFTTNPGIADRWTKALQMNLITVRVANEYDVPVMNFWLAARDLPGGGMMPDNAHLSERGGRINFTGDQNELGFTMRNLVTLQTLDVLRRELIGG